MTWIRRGALALYALQLIGAIAAAAIGSSRGGSPDATRAFDMFIVGAFASLATAWAAAWLDQRIRFFVGDMDSRTSEW
jgi:hypothetical protein